jgi:hypothetical protein
VAGRASTDPRPGGLLGPRTGARPTPSSPARRSRARGARTACTTSSPATATTRPRRSC